MFVYYDDRSMTGRGTLSLNVRFSVWPRTFLFVHVTLVLSNFSSKYTRRGVRKSICHKIIIVFARRSNVKDNGTRFSDNNYRKDIKLK